MKNYIIADSGATKCQWTIVQNNKKQSISTMGISPYFLSTDEIAAILVKAFSKKINVEKINAIYFYGTGLSNPDNVKSLKKALKLVFKNATLDIQTDLVAAARATCQKNKGIACILGTGSNCSYFDGKILHQKVQSLGYIVMDDCSGNVFGKQLIRKYYFNKMPKELALIFEKEYDLNPDSIKNELYKKANPNAYLATYAKFLIQHKETDFCKKIIFKEMKYFVKNYIRQYENCNDVPIHFIGSIAFYLKDELQITFDKYGLQLGNVLRRPIDGLIAYHITNK